MDLIKKLKSNSGATIVFALTVFMIAAIISTTIILISESSAKLSGKERQDEQAYLAVSSAARLMEKEISSRTVTITTSKDVEEESAEGNVTGDDTEGGTDSEIIVSIAGAETPITSFENDPVSELLIDILSDMINVTGSDRPKSITIKLPDETDYIGYTVVASITTGNKTVQAEGELGDAASSDDSNTFICTYEAFKFEDEEFEDCVYSTSVSYYGYITKAEIKEISIDEGTGTVKTINKAHWSIMNNESQSSSQN